MTSVRYGSRPGAHPAMELDRRDQWEDFAECRTADPEMFFKAKDDARAAKDAKKICGRCPVLEQCLAWALETKQDFGVLGGKDEQERRAIHRRWNRPPKGAKHTTRAQQIVASPEAYLSLVAAQMTPTQIADSLGTNVATVNQVSQILADRAQDTMESAGSR